MVKNNLNKRTLPTFGPLHQLQQQKINSVWGKGADDHILPLGISFSFSSDSLLILYCDDDAAEDDDDADVVFQT